MNDVIEKSQGGVREGEREEGGVYIQKFQIIVQKNPIKLKRNYL